MSSNADNKTEKGLRTLTAFPVLYMFVVMFVGSGILIGVNRLTADRVEANQQILFEKAVLTALGIAPGPKARPATIHDVFTKRVSPPTQGTAGAYRLMDDNQVTAYALPIEGQGFWDIIRGVVGIESDGKTLTGIAFYEQRETPGLGAEITTPGFRQQFQDLELGPAGSPVTFQSAGTELDRNEVHAVTGATQTCRRLERFLNDQLGIWRATMGFTASERSPQDDKDNHDG